MQVRRFPAVLTTTSAALLAAGLVAAPLTGAAPSTTTYANSVPRWATAADDAGPTAAADTVEYEIYLNLPDSAGAQALARAVSTPGNPQYGKYLTPDQWINRFAPSQAAVNQVVNYLKSSGLTIYAVPKDREYVVARGPASAAQTAFGTTLHNYRFQGQILYGPSSAPTLPTAVADLVQGVSADAGRLTTKPDHLTEDGASAQATPSATPAASTEPAPVPCSQYWAQHVVTAPKAYGRTQFPTGPCGYTPGQLRSAYGLDQGINNGNDGTGQTVAIVDAYASPTIVRDTNDYSSLVGAPLLTTYRQIVPKPSRFLDEAACVGPADWQVEQTLDVQSAHGIAPNANILYVGGVNCGAGLDLARSNIVDNGLANIVTNSYGYLGEAVPDSVLTGQQSGFIQAAGEGIGLYFSSGDYGDTAAFNGYPSPSFPASDPWVTSVGGTSLAIGQDGRLLFETGWGTVRDQIVVQNGREQYTSPLPGSFYAGAGGGTSIVFGQPWYQRGTVPASLATSPSGALARVSPDVSALADPYTGFLIGYRPILDNATLQTGPFVTAKYGGTSLASPIVAAEMALAQQTAAHRIGFANPAIYAADRAVPSSVRDITRTPQLVAVVATSASTGHTYLASFDFDTSLKTTAGYDDVTGLGSPNVRVLGGVLRNQGSGTRQ